MIKYNLQNIETQAVFKGSYDEVVLTPTESFVFLFPTYLLGWTLFWVVVFAFYQVIFKKNNL